MNNNNNSKLVFIILECLLKDLDNNKKGNSITN